MDDGRYLEDSSGLKNEFSIISICHVPQGESFEFRLYKLATYFCDILFVTSPLTTIFTSLSE